MQVIPISWIKTLVWILILTRTTGERPDRALKLLLELDNILYKITGRVAIDYGDGNHVKHRLTGYVDTFALMASKLEGPILDVGCNQGEISARLAEISDKQIVGIDLNREVIEEARRRYKYTNLQYHIGDALDCALPGPFKTIILSNVLEHIAERKEFLQRLRLIYDPSYILVRVPNFERDWRVPLKRELGVEFRLDPTHETEHVPRTLQDELESAKFIVKTMELRWGEIWVVAQCCNRK
jgi:2-polyprenyl-3-methyl-5-hydroxy-6-metoxy-1,4-benzoquinol methylase